MLNHETKQQVIQYFNLLENPIVFKLSYSSDAKSNEVLEFLKEIQSCAENKIEIERIDASRSPFFYIDKKGSNRNNLGFGGIPLGHEFTSFIMACLQVSGRAPKIDDSLKQRIVNLKKGQDFTVFMSLSCHNCPEVVQSFNIISVLNPLFSSQIIDGAYFTQEVESKNILAVPCVFSKEDLFFAGKSSLEEIVSKLEALEGPLGKKPVSEKFDTVVIGGGPAAISAAIYSSRKGLKVAILADRVGGQIGDTVGIENFISQTYTEGPKLVSELKEHLSHNSVFSSFSCTVEDIEKNSKEFLIKTNQFEDISAKSVIVATGAKWRNLNVEGEEKFKTKGVAYCPHCDGPFFKGKDVAVVGGGNSGVEAAIDLAAIVKKVYLLEFASSLKADAVLQQKLRNLPNVDIILNAKTTEVAGDSKVTGLSYQDQISKELKHIELQGIFVQIGLVPNTQWLKGLVETNKFGEIIVDAKGKTSVEGIFAAGDCTTVPYKQIVIACGEGAKAALANFEYLTFLG